MEEHFEEQHPERKRKRRKLRVGRVFITAAIFFMMVIAAYSYFQYKQGKALTAGSKIDPGEFQGDLLNPQEPTRENYLLLGIDNDGSGKYRTDTMMVLSWDQAAGTAHLISFMRDIYAQIPGYQSYKLNTAYYLGGVQTAKETISGMFNIPIHHYAVVDFDNFESIMDIAFPKGLEINVQKEMSEKIGVTLKPGVQRLNGKELLGYARFRSDEEGDFGRVARQQEVIQAVKDELFSVSTVMQAPKVVGALDNFIETDLTSKDELTKVLTVIAKRKLDLQSLRIPVEDSYSFTSYRHAGSVIEIDLDKNREAIRSFLATP
ncbi:transcriptional regulator [Sporosarcina sp. P37]|uniref:LCP family protein n=1 Tax=unclassified Sporosarcina TaxID=2647733 RepID=UPI000A17B475|nr:MULTISPECIES: LCP family protein [unclassified Sporosarcina]ARK23451.1 transcriptional regulator [Sporosarcina sp. P37]PID18661.1 LytR family transcriptional regulator [Sporosarcina sp. P35]